ncbi:MAG: zinc-binding dehydrogenase [Deltaproteobacteria bacterium]|nr:MAG: zinc-binding dehydrogenase [Deltaproteobacteria bacterium]
MLAHLLLEPGKIDYREVETPVPGPGEVVVRVSAALTCGTDLKAFLRGHPKMPMPTLFGHEFAGEIAAAGSGVRGFHEGDAVMAVPTAPCKTCYYCRHKQENLCTIIMDTMVLGAYAEYVKLPSAIVETNMFHKERALPYAEAALLEPLSCVVHAIDKLTPRPDDCVLIIGAGAISLLHLLVLKSLGVERVIVLGRRQVRAQAAVDLGATVLLAPDATAARAQVLDATDGRGADVVIECTGQPQVWEQAVHYVRRGGTVVLFGGCPTGTRVSFDTGRLHYDQITLISPFHFTPRDVRKAHRLLSEGRINGRRLISGTYTFSALDQVLALLQQGQGIKYALVPQLS